MYIDYFATFKCSRSRSIKCAEKSLKHGGGAGGTVVEWGLGGWMWGGGSADGPFADTLWA